MRWNVSCIHTWTIRICHPIVERSVMQMLYSSSVNQATPRASNRTSHVWYIYMIGCAAAMGTLCTYVKLIFVRTESRLPCNQHDESSSRIRERPNTSMVTVLICWMKSITPSDKMMKRQRYSPSIYYVALESSERRHFNPRFLVWMTFMVRTIEPKIDLFDHLELRSKLGGSSFLVWTLPLARC